MKSMKKELLAAVAATALIAAVGGASAQTKMESQGPGGAEKSERPGQGGPAAETRSGAQVQSPAQRGGAPRTEGSGGAEKTEGPGQGGPTQQGQTKQPDGEKPAQLSEQQRTQIGTTMRKQSNLRRVERNSVNFTINIGGVVPRTVNLAPLPAPILTMVPAYRGYLYIVVGDDLLIVHPRTYEIVAVIPA